MTHVAKKRRSLETRIKAALLSLLAFALPATCACCYAPPPPSPIPQPTTLSSPLSAPSSPLSPVSPRATPTVSSPLPTPSEARRSLRKKLITEGRFPGRVAGRMAREGD